MKWLDGFLIVVGLLIMGCSYLVTGRLQVGIFLLGAGIGTQALVIPAVVWICQRYFSHPERDEEQPHELK
ncbi:hypothetical protein [Fructilactobacillus carniphilus]|uniref:Uncharacterized protein n=1 Tax=Fructilactobacillus carniphilus TaxID=2940297 RepID=A0ABY5BWW3_9LACO|nr:hypothetical protein [Fructilactobacillus carniphilus]USS90982.1 hypothetical protein M3M37_01885 [Fructilactobacillus carniphilus]